VDIRQSLLWCAKTGPSGIPYRNDLEAFYSRCEWNFVDVIILIVSLFAFAWCCFGHLDAFIVSDVVVSKSSVLGFSPI
jgi:hypothetical protein